MMFIAMAFVVIFLYGAPLCGIGSLVACLALRALHRRYLARTQDDPPRRWRRIASILFGVWAGICLLAGAAGWTFILMAGM